MADAYQEVLEEIPKERADLGYPPLVTPLSQMVGTQALMNIVSGQRYQVVPNEIKDYVKGLYGHPPVSIKPEMVTKIIGDQQPITQRPADLLAPQLPEFEKEIQQYAHNIEDVLMYALFPEQARDFLGRREDRFYDVPVQKIDIQFETEF